MSYYQGPPGNYPPPNNYQQPPPGQGWGQPPPQQNWGQQPPPNQYGAPPGQSYQQPPPGQWGAPPQQNWQQPPPGQWGAPPNQGYQQPPSHSPYPPPQQGYGPPPPQQGYGPPPQQSYGAPAPGQYGAPAGPPTQASLGYIRNQPPPPMNIEAEIAGLNKAMKGFGTNEKELIRILSKQDPLQIQAIRQGYNQRFMKDLVKDLEKETSGYFEKGLVAIARGPLVADCHALREAIKGVGTKESVLNEVLCNRSNADIHAIKEEYQHLFKASLEADLRGDLSAATEQLFVMLVSGRRNEDSAPVNPQQVEQDCTELQRAMGNMVSKDALHACQILTSRNDAQIRAISSAYQQRYMKSLDTAIKDKFSGHMEDALRLIIARANNRALSDAEQLEAAMAGLGTKDNYLVQRVVRVHWNRQYTQAVKQEYQKKYRKDLVSRIKGETRGDYERLMVACIE